MASKISQLFEKENYEKISAVIEKAVEYANSKSVSNAAKVKKWLLLKRDFSMPTNELTPTQKLKRNKIEENFKEEIALVESSN